MSGRYLKTLHVNSLRNLAAVKLNLHEHFNVFVGPNGSGKTSILESIYLLGIGRSFRIRETAPLIRDEDEALTIYAKTNTDDTICLLKSRKTASIVRINQQGCRSTSELARFLPCQIIHQGIFQIIDAGASVRRSLLDWGMFHVKHSYHALWKDYRRVLKQRNALLKQRASYSQCYPWDKQLSALAEQMHGLRQSYFDQWTEAFNITLKALADFDCNITYDKGWGKKDTELSLESVLEQQYASDVKRQYTQSGPHHADILFNLNSKAAKQILSRGQQKIILIALKLAQAQLLPHTCVYLFDDIAAELDKTHLQRVIDYLMHVKGQYILTSLHPAELVDFIPREKARYFSLSEGTVTDVSRETF